MQPMQQTDDKSSLVTSFFSQAAPTFRTNSVFEVCAERLVELAGLSSGERVLDIGSGTGAVLIRCAAAVGTAGFVHGIDLVAPMVDAARGEVERRGIRNVELQQMNAERLDFPDESFDAVLCGFVVQFIPDLPRALAEVSRVLRPGGQFAASVWRRSGSEVAGSEIMGRYSELRARQGYPQPEMASRTFESHDALAQYVAEAGFTVRHASTEQVVTEYADEQDFWARRTNQATDREMSPADLSSFKQSVFEMLRSISGPQGQIREMRNTVYVVAERIAS
jgi:ubiquinone/menaquinone biosynthesis C-methylase UbiE